MAVEPGSRNELSSEIEGETFEIRSKGDTNTSGGNGEGSEDSGSQNCKRLLSFPTKPSVDNWAEHVYAVATRIARSNI